MTSASENTVPAGTESAEKREKLFDTLRRRIFRSLLRRSIRPDEADDLSQKAILVALSRFDDGRSTIELLKVTFGIVRMLLKERRHQPALRQEPLESCDLRDTRPSPEVASIREERMRIIERSVDRLDGRCREVTKLRLLNYSRAEIAAALGISANLAGVLEKRCLERLLKILNGGSNRPGEAHA